MLCKARDVKTRCSDFVFHAKGKNLSRRTKKPHTANIKLRTRLKSNFFGKNSKK